VASGMAEGGRLKPWGGKTAMKAEGGCVGWWGDTGALPAWLPELLARSRLRRVLL
jgi:hypothetical protein